MKSKKVTKRVAKKPATKKAKSIKAVQTLRDGFKAGTKKNPLPHVKHNNVAISDISNEKFPEMVQITMGPAKVMNEIGGKKYVNLAYAIMAVDSAHADNLIEKGATGIKKELLSVGINSSTPVSNAVEQGGKIYLSKDAGLSRTYGVNTMLRNNTQNLYYSE
jgi:hypothetical protein